MDSTMIPEGRILIDTEKSFTYREGGLKGVLIASRLSGLSPNITSRFTPVTLISSYEVFEVLGQARSIEDLRRIEPDVRKIYQRYLSGLEDVDPMSLTIHRRVGKASYSRRCAEA